MKASRFLTALVLSLCCSAVAYSQRSIAITIDDIPNSKLTIEQKGKSALLQALDSMHIPTAIFINEENVDKIIEQGGNDQVLRSWIAAPLTTIGNHTFSHSSLSKTGLQQFLVDVDKGQVRSRTLATESGKTLRYFRFPYNDCGKDSLQQDSIFHELTKRSYTVTPFSVESADYAFDKVYVKRLEAGDSAGARAVGRAYVDLSLKLLDYIDSVASAKGATNLAHIYLCHDNALDRDYLPELIRAFMKMGFQCISLDAALEDPNYKRPLRYKGKAGMSWVYRWIDDSKERRKIQVQEPENAEIIQEYTRIQQEAAKH